MRRTVGYGEGGIRWQFTTKLDDLDFVDDLTLLSTTKEQIQENTARLREEAGRVELEINGRKTKVMRVNVKNHDKIKMDGQDIEDVDEFT